MNIKEILLDENNKEPICLIDGKSGRQLTFEQVAVIPHNHKIYCVLKPLTHIDGVGDDEAIVFFVDESGDDPVVKVESNELEAIKIFKKYYRLLKKEIKKR